MMIKNLLSKSLNVYLISLVFALAAFYPFTKIYVIVFKPIITGGSLFLSFSVFWESFFASLYLSFPFFLSVLVPLSSVKNKNKTWLIGMIPFLILSLMNGFLDMFWVLAFSGVGFLIGQVILKMKK